MHLKESGRLAYYLNTNNLSRPSEFRINNMMNNEYNANHLP